LCAKAFIARAVTDTFQLSSQDFSLYNKINEVFNSMADSHAFSIPWRFDGNICGVKLLPTGFHKGDKKSAAVQKRSI
jgi:hypothetical protein